MIDAERDNVRELVRDALVQSRDDGRGDRARLACPMCEQSRGKSDASFALSVDRATGLFYCWRCHAGGKLANAPGAIIHANAPITNRSAYDGNPPRGYMLLAEEPGLSYPALGAARAYLFRRGVEYDTMRAYQIGACAFGYYGGRVVVPILDTAHSERWLGWAGRDFTGNAERKYIYPRGMQRHLFNGAALALEADVPAIVVEGVFDALALAPDGVAVLGKPSRDHMEQLARAKRPIAVALDGDAWREGWALAVQLQLLGQRAGSVRLPPCTDPDEVPREALHRAARACIGQFDPVEARL